MGKVLVDVEQLLDTIRQATRTMLQEVLSKVGMADSLKACPVCRNDFLASRETQIHCSRRCRVVAHRKRRRMSSVAGAVKRIETPDPF